ncbi:lysozyme [Pseudoxanthomonas sp. JBR18]|uniref:lysozyme n=1 Tax=Pseudoxanthomonas sp. JBR18 TaxID=2969308 RepID=UPI002305CDC2|nr:lysozyme [Pseudoxanthomonas sp. JBR18]WCE04443.1 lysozyme [Pseudoxanthomonas sp. JBR18]
MTTKKPTGKKTAVGGAITAAVLAAAALFVQPWEGREFKPYRDAVGVLTACDGHTGPDIQAGKTYTAAECDVWLMSDIGRAYSQVRLCISVPLNQNQAVAFTSAAYNLGPSVVCGSTLQRKANAGDLAGACAQLDRWVYAKGQKLRGLVRRRAAERALCES